MNIKRNEPPNRMKRLALIAIIIIIFFGLFGKAGVNDKSEVLKYSEFIKILNGEIPGKTIHRVKIGDKEITGDMSELRDPSEKKPDSIIPRGDTEFKPFKVIIPDDPGLMNILRNTTNLIIEAESPAQTGWLLTILVNWVPFLVIIAIWFFVIKSVQGGGTNPLAFGKSRVRMVDPADKKITFKDVAGVIEAKEDLCEVVEFLKEPKKFTNLGAKIPRGVLLYGPPGTGKTLLARAVAGEANVPFFNISGSDFVEMFVGVGASRVRDLFEKARNNAPCIIFMDEIDAVGRQRGAGLGGGHDEREQTLNQLLVEMDGFDNTKGLILIAATNRPDVLDPALLRPGRFDRRIVVDQPDIRGREEILQIHVREKPIADDVELGIIARRTPGFVGADLANLTNEAAILAARRESKVIVMKDFEESIDKIIAGTERKSRIISEKEKTNTAYHEMGHAIVAASLPEMDPVHKITIIPRGMALGLTMQLPEEDRLSASREYLKNQICVLLAGRMAERLVFNEMTSGASNDIERATKIARKMVCELGMSDEIGPMHLADTNQPIFLGRDFATRNDISDETAKAIDREVKKLIDWGCEKAKEILTDKRDILERGSQYLLERETINAEEFAKIMKGEELPPMILGEEKPKADVIDLAFKLTPIEKESDDKNKETSDDSDSPEEA